MKRLNVLIMVANTTKWYVRIGLKEDGKVTLSREEGGMGNKVRDQPWDIVQNPTDFLYGVCCLL
jgi:hypothetical protein